MSKKIFSLLLSVALILSIAPLSAFAEGVEDLPSDLSTRELELIYNTDYNEADFVPGEVIVGLNKTSDAALFKDYVSTLLNVKGTSVLCSKDKGSIRDVFLITLEEETKQAVIDAIGILKYDSNVSYAEPNYITYLCW